jgi:hypothetical protein
VQNARKVASVFVDAMIKMILKTTAQTVATAILGTRVFVITVGIVIKYGI